MIHVSGVRLFVIPMADPITLTMTFIPKVQSIASEIPTVTDPEFLGAHPLKKMCLTMYKHIIGANKIFSS